MANPNVRKKIEKIVAELQALEKHVNMYGGIPEKDARAVLFRLEDLENAAAGIAYHIGRR